MFFFRSALLLIYLKIVISIAVFVILLVIFTYLPGRFLVVADKPQKRTVIVVFAGEFNRVGKAVELWQKGYAAYIIFTGNKGEAVAMADYAMKKGILKDSIIIEDKADSTYQNMLFAKNIMDINDWKTAIIVSSDYHMRRIKLLSEMLCSEYYVFSFVPVKSDSEVFDREYWWSTNGSVKTTLLEYKKLFGTVAGYAK